jgi:hypothetical protein
MNVDWSVSHSQPLTTIKDTSKNALFPQLLRQLRAGAPARSILMVKVHSGSPRGASGTPDRLTSEKLLFLAILQKEKTL